MHAVLQHGRQGALPVAADEFRGRGRQHGVLAALGAYVLGHLPQGEPHLVGDVVGHAAKDRRHFVRRGAVAQQLHREDGRQHAAVHDADDAHRAGVEDSGRQSFDQVEALLRGEGLGRHTDLADPADPLGEAEGASPGGVGPQDRPDGAGGPGEDVACRDPGQGPGPGGQFAGRYAPGVVEGPFERGGGAGFRHAHLPQ